MKCFAKKVFLVSRGFATSPLPKSFWLHYWPSEKNPSDTHADMFLNFFFNVIITSKLTFFQFSGIFFLLWLFLTCRYSRQKTGCTAGSL